MLSIIIDFLDFGFVMLENYLKIYSINFSHNFHFIFGTRSKCEILKLICFDFVYSPLGVRLCAEERYRYFPIFGVVNLWHTSVSSIHNHVGLSFLHVLWYIRIENFDLNLFIFDMLNEDYCNAVMHK